MRLLHISDFHLDKNDKEDSQNHIIKPLLATIKKTQNEAPIDLILFTGDLVNIGGKNHTDLEEAFMDFEETFIEPLLTETNLSRDNFLFVPGNHDINRTSDSESHDLGLVDFLDTQEKINAFFKKPECINRIKSFHEFEKYFYDKSSSKITLSPFYSTFKFEIKGVTVGICCLNSAWRCYDSRTDKGKILIGENQIINSLNDIKDCEIKIALSHHHFNYLNKFDGDIISVLLKQDFNMFFSGHTHTSEAGYIQDPDGQLFSFCASGILSPSIRESEKKYENGFSIIDYHLNESKLKASFYKAEYPKKEFIVNSSIADNGVWNINIPVGDEVKQLVYEQNLIKEITSDSTEQINSHLLSHSTDTEAPKALEKLFVMPNIVIKEQFDAEKDDKTINSLDEIINSKKNYVVFGTKESGKTILLDKLLVETLETNKAHHQIPAFIDFKEFTDNPIKLIRKFWSKSSEEAKDILCKFKIILFIDNISFDDENIHKIRRLKQFLDEYPEVRFVASYQQIYEEDFPLNMEITSLLNFENITLKQFKTKQIKQLIRKWFPNSDKYDTPKKLETLTNAFLTLNLPRTPFAVSMFLWIIEKQENFKPINNSTLIENFIEKILKKHDIKESRRERFNYDNKIWIISYLALEMLNEDKENYCLSHTIFSAKVDKYLKWKKFEDFETEKIVKILLESGIFINENGNVRFRFSCFFEFFLMKQMENDPEFKERVLSPNEFLNFTNEIDYFTGINRGDKELVDLVISRLEIGFNELEEMITDTQKANGYKNFDGFFIPKDEKGKEKPSLVNQLNEEKVVTFLPSNKPSEEDIEIIQDNKLELQKTEKGITKKVKSNDFKNLGKLLVLALRVINNSEEISDRTNVDLKLKNYSTVLKKSILFAILHKAIFELFLQNQDKIPQSRVEEFSTMSKYLPLLHEIFLFENVGSQKLTSVIREKINLDNQENVSDFEKALSVFLYSDIRGKDYDKIISKFIKNVETKYIEDLIFFKLLTYYFYRAYDDEKENFYLNLIADLMIKSKGFSKDKKSEIMINYKKKKKEKSSQEKEPD